MFTFSSKKKQLEVMDLKPPKNNFFTKVKLAVYLFVSVALLTLIIGYLIYYSKYVTHKAVADNQAAMVDVVTDEIVIGSVYKPPADGDQGDGASESGSLAHQEEVPSAELSATAPKTNSNYRALPLSEDNKSKARISIVITGVGLSEKQTNDALSLNNSITLGFSPYAGAVSEWINRAVDKGFETLLQLPMEPEDYQTNDPGPLALLQNLSLDENIAKVNKIIDLSDKNVGFYTDTNEVISNSKMDIQPVLGVLSDRDYIYLHAQTKSYNAVKDACKNDVKAQCLFVDSSLQEELSEAVIYSALNRVTQDAVAQGHVILYLNSYPSTVEILKKWLLEINSNQVIVVPLSNQLIAK